MERAEPRQVPLCELEQAHRRRQTPAMLRVRRMFKLLLKVNESAGCLDQSLEEVRVARIGLQPKLLEDIMRFVIMLFVPTTEKRAVKRVLCDVRPTEIDIVTTQLRHQLRNPLAFVHGKLNLMAAQRMSKPAFNSFPVGKNRLAQAGELWQQAWTGYHKR